MPAKRSRAERRYKSEQRRKQPSFNDAVFAINPSRYLPYFQVMDEINKTRNIIDEITNTAKTVTEVGPKLIERIHAGYIIICESTSTEAPARFHAGDVTKHLEFDPMSKLVFRYALPIHPFSLQKLCDAYSSLFFGIDGHYYEMHVRFTCQPAKLDMIREICNQRDRRDMEPNEINCTLQSISLWIDVNFEASVPAYLI